MNSYKKLYYKIVALVFSPKKESIKESSLEYKAYGMLEFSINNNVLVVVDQKNRGIGKTTALIEKADEFKCTLIVAGQVRAAYAKEKAARMGLNIDVLYFTDVNQLKDLNMKNNKYLIDENVPLSIIKDLRGNKRNELIGGFISL